MLMAAACTPPAVVERTAPSFPSGVSPVAAGGTLTAGVRVILAPDGSVAHDEIAQSTGIPLFDTAALEAAKRWRFAALGTACSGDPANIVSVEFTHVPLPPSYDPCSHDAFELMHVQAEYPQEAHDIGLGSRQVILSLPIDASGKAGRPQVVRSSGNLQLDYAAEQAAHQSIYAPAAVNCRAARGRVRFTENFTA